MDFFKQITKGIHKYTSVFYRLYHLVRITFFIIL